MATLLTQPFAAARRGVALCLAWATVLGCNQPHPSDQEQEKQQAATLVVFAASSLSNAFHSLEPAFREMEPSARLVYHFAGTQELRTQIEQGAVADVFAAADERHMNALLTKGYVAAPLIFATNELVVAVAEAARGKIHSFSDLPRAERIVLGAPEVPIGRYSLEILTRANKGIQPDFAALVEAKVVSREHNVKQVLAKVRLGEADAAIVYKTDLQNADDHLGMVAIPTELNVIASYPVATVRSSKTPKLAKAFVTLLESKRGQDSLRAAGFTLPGAPPKAP